MTYAGDLDLEKFSDAHLLKLCTVILHRNGATTPIPDPDRDWLFSGNVGAPKHCPTCGHPVHEHGAAGECWHLADYLGSDCRCGR